MYRTLRISKILTQRRLVGNLVHPGNQDAFTELLKSDSKTVLYYTAAWCPPCRAIAPEFEKLSKNYDDIIFAKIDVDSLPEAADFANIRSVPTFLFRNKQANVSEFSGADLRKLESNIAALNEL